MSAQKAVDVGGVDLAAHVLSGAVTDGVVRQAAPSEAAVPQMLIGRHNVNLVRNRLVYEAFQRLGVGRLVTSTWHPLPPRSRACWVGEVGEVGVAAAIANALHPATGKRIRKLLVHVEDLLA